MSKTRVPAEYLASDVGRLNQLSNGGFEVWQRGSGPFTTGYGPDRWLLGTGGGSSLSVIKDIVNTDGSGACAAIVYTHAGGGMGQITVSGMSNDHPQMIGRTMSFSVRVRTNVAGNVRAGIYESVGGWHFGSYHSGSGLYETLTVTAVIPAGASNVQPGIYMNVASASVYVDNASMVFGPIAADYIALPPADDLARCLRYYEILGYGYGDVVGPATVWSTTQIDVAIKYQVRKTIVPTLTVPGPANLQALVVAGGGWAPATTSAGAIFNSYNGCVIAVNFAAQTWSAGQSSICMGGAAGNNIVSEANP